MEHIETVFQLISKTFKFICKAIEFFTSQVGSQNGSVNHSQSGIGNTQINQTTINNHNTTTLSPKNAIEDNRARKALFDQFQSNGPMETFIVNTCRDSVKIINREQTLNKTKKDISEKFNRVDIGNSRAQDLINIHNKALTAIDDLRESGNEEKFREDWTSCRESLLALFGK